MNAREIITEGISQFNDKQKETGRRVLETMEKRILLFMLEEALADKMGQLRDELESVASQADLDLQRELDWATDIIVASMRMNDKLRVELEDEKIVRIADLYTLKVERSEGRTTIELIKNAPPGSPKSPATKS